MSESKTDFHGSRSETPRATAVRTHFETNGVPGSKLCVVDGCRPRGRRYPFETNNRNVTVWERPADKSDDMTGREFASFMTQCNRIVNADPNNRFTNDDETRCAISHGYVDSEIMSQQTPNPAEAGNDLADPNKSGQQFTVFHHGGNRFTVQDTWSEDGRMYRVDMDKPLSTGEPCEAILEGQPEPTVDEAQNVIGAVVEAGPSFREGPQEQLNVTVEAPEPGNADSTESSDDTTESDTDDSESADTFDGSKTPDTVDEDTEILENWFERYAGFKSDFDADAVDIESGAIEGTEGYKIETTAPWEAGYHDGNEWTRKDDWDAHGDAFSELMQSDDAEAVQWYGEPDWFNFIPASAVEEVAE